MNTGIILAFLSSVTWGLTYALDQKILEKLGPFTTLFLNYLFSIILIIPFMFYFEKDFLQNIVSNKNSLNIIILSILTTFAANIFIMISIKSIDASNATIIEITYPIFVIFFSYFIFKTIPNFYFVIGGILILCGIFFVIKSTN